MVNSRDQSNEAFDRMIRIWYCSITVANHKLTITIRLVSKNYTHPWKDFANKLRLVLHAYIRLFVKKIWSPQPNTAFDLSEHSLARGSSNESYCVVVVSKIDHTISSLFLGMVGKSAHFTSFQKRTSEYDAAADFHWRSGKHGTVDFFFPTKEVYF